MGKWTVDYYDDVLCAKLKRLVSGAVKRSKLENDEPTITYEAFIEELDEGDGFTSSMFDLLIKEVAERRARPNPFNRHLIAEQTAAGLRSLAAPSRIYRDRDRSRIIRRSRNYSLSEYLADAELPSGDRGEEFDNLLDGGAPAIEGARIDSELYHAYAPTTVYEPFFPSSRRPRSSQSNTAASTVGDDNSERVFPETLLSRSPPSLHTRTESRNSAYTRSTASIPHPPGLSRQPTIRRPLRTSRTTDFNDFTSRRRILHRRNSLEPIDHPRPPPSDTPSLSHARRYFPSSRPRRSEISSPFPWQFGSVENHMSDTTGEPSPDLQSGTTRQAQESLSFAPSLTLPSIESYQSIPFESSTSNSERPQIPRLRRVGLLRPPESMLPRPAPLLGEGQPGRAPVIEGRDLGVAGAEEETSLSEPEDTHAQHLRLHDQVNSLHPSQFLVHQEDSEQYA